MNYLKIPEITVSFRDIVKVSDRKAIYSKENAVSIFKEIFEDFMEHHEEVWAMYLNKANKVIGVSQISKGGISGTIIDTRIILQTALKSSASSIIIVHNHPSGNLNPSDDDVKITRKLKDACQIMDITLLDHIILTRESHFSFCNQTIIL